MAQVSTSPLRNESDMEHDLSFVDYTSGFQNAVFTSLSMVIILGTTGNVLSLSVILFYRRLRLRPFNIIAMFMIVADLISCSVVAPFILTLVLLYIRDNAVNQPICLTGSFFNPLSKLGSLITMTEIAILRVINLSNSVWARRLVSKTSMAVIIIFNIIVIPGWATWKTFFYLDFCGGLQSQSLEPQFGPAAEWCFVFLIIFSCYTGIACYTKTRAGRVAGQRNERCYRYDIATIRTCIVIIVVFVACHFPFLIYLVLLNGNVLSIDLVEIVFYYHFHLFSQAGNPIIMFVTSSEFRKHVLMFVRRFLFRKLCKRNRVVVPAAIALQDVSGVNLRP